MGTMTKASVLPHARPLHPIHAIFLAFPVSLFLGAMLSDLAYWNTYQVQWANFSAWLITGGLVGGSVALVWALVDVVRFRKVGGARVLNYFLVLLVMFVLGSVNELVHAKDAWAIMPEGLYLSAVTALLALVAAWMGYSGYRVPETR
jgi:uncharacterized membrane protein